MALYNYTYEGNDDMQLERRYIIAMSLCFAFLVFICSSGGELFIAKFISMPVDQTYLREVDYFRKSDFNSTSYEDDIDTYFEDRGEPQLKDTVIFHKKRGHEGLLRGGLAMQDSSLLAQINDHQLKQLLFYGMTRLNEATENAEFDRYDFRLGYKEDLYIKLEYSKNEDLLTIRDSYDTTIAYHEINGVDLELIEHSFIDDLPFIFDAKITKLPLSTNHVIVKTYIDDELNFAKKRRFEALVKEKTGATYVSVLYKHKGSVVDKTIASDPSLKSLYLHNDEILYYYTTEQMTVLLKDLE